MSLDGIDPLLAFGAVCLAAAIVGGGLKAFDIEVPVISSILRQALLGGFGFVLVLASQEERITQWLHPPTIEGVGPRTLESAQTFNETVDMPIHGAISVSLISLTQDWRGFNGERPYPGQDGLRIVICGHGERGQCPEQQVAQGGTFAREISEGRATISFENFGTSPRMAFSAAVSHPQ